MYTRLAETLRILQRRDTECAIRDAYNGKAEPLRSPGEFPKQGDDHGKFERHFSIDDEVPWTWDDNIKKDRPRRFVGTFWLLSDVLTYELLNYSRINLRIQNKIELEVKPLQSFMTKVGYVVLGLHANVNSLDVVTEFRNALIEIEKNMFEEKRLFGSDSMDTDLPIDRRYKALDDLWKALPFPEMVTVRSFPKGSAYEKGEPGVDESWKQAIHFEYSIDDAERIEFAVDEFIKLGGVELLFGSCSVLEVPPEAQDNAGKAECRKLVPRHQNTNRSVGNVTIPGIVDLDAVVDMYFEPPKEGKMRTSKAVTLRHILRKVYVKINERRFAVFLYAFHGCDNNYQIWFWDKVPEIREFVEKIGKNLTGYMWHRALQWGWDEGCLRRLFTKALDSNAAIAAMNSKWSAKRETVIEVATGSEAAARLNFGTSQFILAEGEVMKKATPKRKPVIERCDLDHDVKGGKELDDLKSVGDASNCKTVNEEYWEDYDYDEDDAVSEMSDNEESMEDDDDAETRDGCGGRNADAEDEEEDDGYESGYGTTAGGRDMDVDEDEDDDHSCATRGTRYRGKVADSDESEGTDTYATKENGGHPDLDDLAAGGRKVRSDSNDADKARIKELEEANQALEKAMEERIAAMELKFQEQLSALLVRGSQMPDNVNGPGAVGGTAAGETSENSASAGASAGNK
jgi:hypothetical protein